jgi:RNA polymerase sigma-70 factor (ECF subfamily)
MTPHQDSFDAVVLPHLAAARRLARWLLRGESEAEDAVQEASLRALRYFGTFTGGNGRAWFLQIVRNTCHTWRARHRVDTDPFDELHHVPPAHAPDPEALLLQQDAHAVVAGALEQLTERSRTLLLRREVEGLTYQELSEAMRIPKGTVMSGLSRARHAFRVAAGRELARRDRGIRRVARRLDRERGRLKCA